MAKHTLVIESDFDYDIIGVCSHSNDYKLCWAINNNVELQLHKSENSFMVSGKKGNVISSHSMYEWISEEENVNFYLIKNKDGEKFLIPEKSQIDYFLIIQEAGIIEIEVLLEKLRKIPEVLTAFIFDPYELKSAERLIF
ncbi:MAG: IPExxxVDY family protein [Brumimicrobium sp.]